MEYNSQKEDLVIPEYGRNVQQLIRHARTIDDPKYRQVFVERVVDLMMQMNPHSRNMDDYRDKLWKHVFQIAEYQLEVDPPNGERPTREDMIKRPDMIPYPVSEARYRHYGHNVQELIKKAIDMPEGPKRDGFVATIAAYMKLAYRTWNKEHYVSDDIIRNDLRSLSKGKLQITDDQEIENLTDQGGSNNNNNRRRGGSNKKNNNSGNRQRSKGRKRKNN